MKKTLLVLSLLAIAGALALVWHFTGGSPADSPAVVTPHGAEPIPAPAPKEQVANLPKASEQDTPDRVTVDATADKSRTQALLADATWVDVAVAMPPGTPTDEKIELTAVVFASDRFAGDADVDAGIEKYKAMRAQGFNMFSRIPRHADDGAKAEELACEPTGDGRFRAPFAKGSRKGLLRLSGRYAYLGEPQLVDLPSSGVTVSPKLGAWLTASLRLPANLPGDVDANALEPFEINLNGWRMSSEGEAHGDLLTLEKRLDFEFGGLHPGLTYFLQGTSPQFVAFTDLQLTPEAGQHLERHYDLHIGGFVEGRVVDDSQSGVAQANLTVENKRARGFFGGNFNNRGSQTDAQGNFKLRAIDAGKVVIRAALDGYVDGKTEQLEIVDGQRLDGVVIHLGRGNSVAGRVVWPDGKPAAGARVKVVEHNSKNPQRPWEGWAQHAAKAGDDGRFSVSGMQSTTVSVVATHAGIGEPPEADETPQQVDTDDGDVAVVVASSSDAHGGKWTAHKEDVEIGSEVVLTLEAPHEVHGRVVDDTGASIAKFTVHAETDFGGGGTNNETTSSENTDGKFTILLAAGKHKLTCDADEHASAPEQDITVPGSAEVLFTLPRASQVSGIVFDPAGQPAIGATVEINGSGSARWLRATGDSSEGKTDDQGRFVLKSVSPGACSLAASKKDYATSEAQTLEVVAGRPITDVRLSLRIGGRVEGEIYTSTGAPDPGRNIMVGNFSGGGMGGSGTSDSAGHFVVEHVVPGKHNVMAVPKMEAMLGGDAQVDEASVMASLKMTTVEVVDGQTAHVVLGAPPKAPVHLTGRVTQAGKPFSDGMVMAIADGKSMLDSMKMGKLDAGGRYSLTLDAPGDYTLIVGEQMGDDHACEFQETIPEVAEYELDLAVPMAGIRGRVTGRDGSPLQGVPVMFELEGRGSLFALDMGRSIETDDDGRYELKNLRPGVYTVRAGANRMDFLGNARRSWSIGVRPGVAVEADRVTDGIDFRLEAPGIIEGTVVNADGKPVASAAVFVRDAQGRLLNPMSTCMTDGLGKFKFDGASVGTCTASARSGSLSSRESGAIRVTENEKASVELRLEAGTILRVSVEDAEGKTVRATLRVLDDAGRDFSNMLGGDMLEMVFTEGFSSTEQRIGPLPAGKYKVTATAPDGATTTKPVTLNGQEERTLRIKMKE